jgi:hypothetical protein
MVTLLLYGETIVPDGAPKGDVVFDAWEGMLLNMFRVPEKENAGGGCVVLCGAVVIQPQGV